MPDSYVRDYRDNNGFITICRGYKSIPWRGDGLSTQRVYKDVPKETLLSIPRGQVKAADTYREMALVMPGWRRGLRENADKLTYRQRVRIQRRLRMQLWPDIPAWVR